MTAMFGFCPRCGEQAPCRAHRPRDTEEQRQGWDATLHDEPQGWLVQYDNDTTTGVPR